jgi:hypothetical protein
MVDIDGFSHDHSFGIEAVELRYWYILICPKTQMWEAVSKVSSKAVLYCGLSNKAHVGRLGITYRGSKRLNSDKSLCMKTISQVSWTGQKDTPLFGQLD